MVENSRKLNLSIPTKPDLRIIDAKYTLFSEETSTCKFNNQKKNGNIGILILKIMKLKNQTLSNRLCCVCVLKYLKKKKFKKFQFKNIIENIKKQKIPLNALKKIK